MLFSLFFLITSFSKTFSYHLIFEARHSATSQSLYLSNYLSMLFTNYLDRIQIPKPFAFLPIPSRSVRRMKTKHPLRSLLSPPSSPACNQRNQIPDFAFEIKRWRGKANEMGNLEFVEWKRAPINDISGRSFADELRSKRLRKLNYR